MDALVLSGLDTLTNRRHECCMKFISKVRECKYDSNPLVSIVKEASYDPVHEYNFRNNNSINYLILGQNDSGDLLRLNVINN